MFKYCRAFLAIILAFIIGTPMNLAAKTLRFLIFLLTKIVEPLENVKHRMYTFVVGLIPKE